MLTDKELKQIRNIQSNINKVKNLLIQFPNNTQFEYNLKLLEAQIAEIVTGDSTDVINILYERVADNELTKPFNPKLVDNIVELKSQHTNIIVQKNMTIGRDIKPLTEVVISKIKELKRLGYSTNGFNLDGFNLSEYDISKIEPITSAPSSSICITQG